MNFVRMFLWALVAVSAAFFAYMAVNLHKSDQQVAGNSAVSNIGGPFDLVRHDGSSISYDDVKGAHHAIFFGFTNCPDICPGTLLHASKWLQELGDDADQVKFYFFSVDPERDTPTVLSDYVNAFDSRITGITGDPEKVRDAISAYRVYAKRVDLDDGDYTMDHQASVMLFRPGGDFVGTISYNEPEDMALGKLRKLLKNS